MFHAHIHKHKHTYINPDIHTLPNKSDLRSTTSTVTLAAVATPPVVMIKRCDRLVSLTAESQVVISGATSYDADDPEAG
eukprot:1272057-Amorphochlora_amoeboformis.AAC.1